MKINLITVIRVYHLYLRLVLEIYLTIIRVIFLYLSFIEIQKPTPNEQQYQIRSDESRHDAKIPPSILEGKSKGFEELVAGLVCTILAIARVVIRYVS